MSTVADLMNLLRRPVATSGKKPAQPAPDIAEIEAAIARLQVERADAEARIQAMPEQREALIERADTDDQIAELERETDKLHLTVERLDRLEPELFARLNALRSDARRKQWVELRDRYIAAAAAYHEALLVLPDLLAGMSAVAVEMEANGFFVEARARPPVPFMARALVLEEYRLALSRYAALDANRAAPAIPCMTPEQWAGAWGVGGPTPLENVLTRGGQPVQFGGSAK